MPEILRIGRIIHIEKHPVKALGGVEVQQAVLTKEGLEGDRQFMVVRAKPDNDGVYHFITQRDKRDEHDKAQGLAVMALVKPRYEGDTLLLTWNGNDPIEVPADKNSGHEIPVEIWKYVVQAVD